MAQTKKGARIIAAAKVGVSVDTYLARLAAGLKHCRVCRVWKPSADFNKDRSRSDALAALCRLCQKGGPKQLRLIRATPAEIQRHRYKTDPEYRFRTRQRVYARKRSIAPLPAIARDVLTDWFGGKCAYCCIRPATTWDHIVPVSDGGRTEPGNILPACRSCNSKKKTMNVFDFIDRYGIEPSNELMNALNLAVAWGALAPPEVVGATA